MVNNTALDLAANKSVVSTVINGHQNRIDGAYEWDKSTQGKYFV
jgi:hypothetical protein